MSELCSRRAFLKAGKLALGMAALCQLSLSGRALAAPEKDSRPEETMLIAFFSHTGNTALVAEEIQKLTHAARHRISSAEVYPEEHSACSDLA